MKKLFFIVGVLFLALPSVSFASTTYDVSVNGTSAVQFGNPANNSWIVEISGTYYFIKDNFNGAPSGNGVVNWNVYECPDSSCSSSNNISYNGNNPSFVTTISNYSSGAPVTCTDFTYTNFSTCSNSSQSRSVTSSSPSGCTGGSPVLSQSCSAPVAEPYNVSVNGASAVPFGNPANNSWKFVIDGVYYTAKDNFNGAPSGDGVVGWNIYRCSDSTCSSSENISYNGSNPDFVTTISGYGVEPTPPLLTSSLFETFLLSLRNNSYQIVLLLISLYAIWLGVKIIKRVLHLQNTGWEFDSSGRGGHFDATRVSDYLDERDERQHKKSTDELVRETDYWIKENDRIDASYKNGTRGK